MITYVFQKYPEKFATVSADLLAYKQNLTTQQLNKLTAEFDYSRSNRENLLLPIQMQLH